MKKNLNTILSQYNFSSSDIISIKELPSGINFVHLIETTKGKYVLKNYKKVKPPYLLDVHRILVSLVKNNAPIPPLVPNKDGAYLTEVKGEYFDLAEFIEHVDLSDQITIGQDDLVLSGKTLAELQKALAAQNISAVVKKVDFTQMAQSTLQAVEDFMSDFEAIRADAKNPQDQHKLTVLKEIIAETETFRAKGVEGFSKFLSQPYVPTHGDFSMVNVLIKPDRRRVFVTDWDGLSLRPLVWDLQAALSLFSLSKLGNAYFMKPDLNKMKAFLKGYLSTADITQEQILLLPEVVKYNFAIYWLSYTLPAMIERDYRLLFLIPDQKEDALYWLKGFQEYEEFVAAVAKELTSR